MKNRSPTSKKQGAALLVSLWALIILALIVGSFSFQVALEGMLVSRKKKQFKAEMLARSGVDYARAIIEQNQRARELEIEALEDDPDQFMQSALYVQRGLSTTTSITITNMGTFLVTIESAENGRNVNTLNRAQWIEIFEMANVPSTEWDSLIDCLEDWIDEGDLHGLNGAESDDPYYEEQGYPVKNGPLDSVEELLLIKHWNESILYGKSADDRGDAIYGIADLLTVWGDGKVNLNSASTNVLLSYAEYEDWELEGVLESRKGLDGIEGTLDDGLRSIDEVNADGEKFKLQSTFLKVTSIGDAGDTAYRIEVIMQLQGSRPLVVYWNEKPEA
ncbi:MAG: general secretion pathway protein GspK [Pontiellaceae bacterium]|tara:strand:- start:1914 stop:2912 length:999 start_codon:yes stop_codon:yes gene_type:complete